MLGALLGAARRAHVGHRAAPVLDAIDAARHELDEVEVEPAVEAQHRLREQTRIMIELGDVAPERDRWPIHRPPLEGGENALAFGHEGPSILWRQGDTPWRSRCVTSCAISG